LYPIDVVLRLQWRFDPIFIWILERREHGWQRTEQ